MKQLNEQLWLTQEGEHYIIGVTKDFQCDAGDVSYVQIAPIGNIEVDDTLVNVEASKAAIEVPMPIRGTIIERNERAEQEPSLLDSNNPEDNWLVKMTNLTFEGIQRENIHVN